MKKAIFNLSCALIFCFGFSALGSEENTLEQIHNTNQKEIKVGELAIQKGSSAAVRKYGQHLVTDHKKADAKILAYAKAHDITLGAAEPKDADQNEAMKQQAQAGDDLKDLKGQEFDSAFLDAMEKGHNDAISMVKEARNESNNADFKKLLGDLLPELQQHHDMAARLDKNLTKKTKY